MTQTGTVSRIGLNAVGISDTTAEFWNLGTEALIEEALARREGHLGKGGAFITETGSHTGRSAKDKFIVDEPSSSADIWWGDVNKPISDENYQKLKAKVLAHYAGRDVFVQDSFVGADPTFRLGVRVVTETAWHNLFARNMFLQPTQDELKDFDPQFTILQAPTLLADPETDGTNSGTFIVVNFAEKIVLIGGTRYAGEIKKSAFSIQNYLLPARKVLPMHCSANISPEGDTAIFFGLSGTGKTTLSADASRTLIGDDEHGWGVDGVFNFEGGCYAKVIDLSPEAEPEIYATTSMFGTVLENVVYDPITRQVDFTDNTKAENTRASYPIDFIPNASETGRGGQPKNIIMLTADAFGVLPPISQLTPDQAMYHFLSGYTARVAGTEIGVTEPQATFSTCFGAPFMPRHPTVYAGLLGKLMEENDVKCWLVNTGWSGGGYGVGSRMKIAYTRAMVNAALDGTLASQESRPDPHFGVLVPTSCPGVPSEVLDPKQTWPDKAAYEAAAKDVVSRFEENFKQFETSVDDSVNAAAIRVAA